jgi:hypothetical protein
MMERTAYSFAIFPSHPAICRLIMRNPPWLKNEVQLRIFSDARSIANSAPLAQVQLATRPISKRCSGQMKVAEGIEDKRSR